MLRPSEVTPEMIAEWEKDFASISLSKFHYAMIEALQKIMPHLPKYDAKDCIMRDLGWN